MEELYIRIKNGLPFEHPIFADNFKEAFPEMYANNLRSEFVQFVRIPMPILNVYEILEGTTYELQNEVYTDVHHVREMTELEKIEKQNTIKNSWQLRNGYASWVFDELICDFKPPIEYPQDNKQYQWDESVVNWVEIVYE